MPKLSTFTQYLLYFFLIFTTVCLFACQQPDQKEANIRLNQIGFYPEGPKLAILENAEAKTFYIISSKTQERVYTGTFSKRMNSPYSDRFTTVADFSDFQEEGTYFISVPELGDSYTFEIKQNIYQPLAQASLKAFYYIRASMPLDEKYAGKWQREAGHPDDQVLIHASAATDQRPEGSRISAPKGWYDAGDYNKYIVNSGITTATLLSLYEDFPRYFDNLSMDIPESENELPDVLDEILWNIRWMLKMQDPNDGGVYHKLTTAGFEGMVMPEQATKTRYVIQKSTAATLDFAAVMAQASRIFDKFPDQLPSLSDSCHSAALYAWKWARQHPDKIYDQQAMNEDFEPDISTGAYGDQSLDDEFFWAASELYVTTRADSFLIQLNAYKPDKLRIPSWNQVNLLAYFSLAKSQNSSASDSDQPSSEWKDQVVSLADGLIENVDNQPYQTVMGKTEGDFNWGSSSNAANQGIALIQAYRITSDKKYLEYALHNLDYLLGRNATGYSFVTGFGKRTPMHPHHRPSVADDFDEPIPGLLSGGPNARAPQQDGCGSYTSTDPEATFTDDDCSYASNEIAINWNAPLVYLSFALEILQSDVN